MLSDRERETLDEIQHRLVTEDPQFTAAFESKARRLTVRGLRTHRTAVTALIVVALLLSVFMIVVQAAGPALFFTAAACGLIWLRRGSHCRNRLQRH
jgi:Flp pilus assembly protein TadB